MRLSVNLDDDLYAVAKSLAKADDTSVSAAVNSLIRKALQTVPQGGLPPHDSTRLPVVRGRRFVTPEDVDRMDRVDEAPPVVAPHP